MDAAGTVLLLLQRLVALFFCALLFAAVTMRHLNLICCFCCWCCYCCILRSWHPQQQYLAVCRHDLAPPSDARVMFCCIHVLYLQYTRTYVSNRFLRVFRTSFILSSWANAKKKYTWPHGAKNRYLLKRSKKRRHEQWFWVFGMRNHKAFLFAPEHL